MLTLRIGIENIHDAPGHRGTRYFGAQFDIQALLLEMPLSLLRNGLVRDRQELLQGFEYDHFAAQPPPDATQLESDDAGADHAKPLRHGVEFQGIPGIDDVLAVVRY